MQRSDAVQKRLDFHVKSCRLCQEAKSIEDCCPIGVALAYLIQQVKK